MTNLVVHVGLPKAASTTLQNTLFPENPGYLGTTRRSSKNADFATEFAGIIRNSDSSAWKAEARAWSERVLEYRNDMWPDCKRLLVSNEHLSQLQPSKTLRYARGGTKCVAAPRLKSFSEEIWTDGRVKALLILRNQPEWLSSRYAQSSNLMMRASQKDFERNVEEIIERHEDYFDWSQWVAELEQALGPENVCTLLIEDMGRESFWKKLAGFAELKDIDIAGRASRNSPNENVRRSRSNVWTMRPWGGLRKSIRARWPEGRLPKALRLTAGLAKRAVESPINGMLKATGIRNGEIEMTAELRGRIQEYCRPFNRRLAAQLERDDLETLGY